MRWIDPSLVQSLTDEITAYLVRLRLCASSVDKYFLSTPETNHIYVYVLIHHTIPGNTLIRYIRGSLDDSVATCTFIRGSTVRDLALCIRAVGTPEPYLLKFRFVEDYGQISKGWSEGAVMNPVCGWGCLYGVSKHQELGPAYAKLERIQRQMIVEAPDGLELFKVVEY